MSDEEDVKPKSSRSAEPIVITVPDGYQLDCIKVHDGASVRIGETIAWVTPVRDPTNEMPLNQTESGSGGTTNDNKIMQQQQQQSPPQLTAQPTYKRPARRKRTIPVSEGKASLENNNTTTTVVSTKSIPTTTENNLLVVKKLAGIATSTDSTITDTTKTEHSIETTNSSQSSNPEPKHDNNNNNNSRKHHQQQRKAIVATVNGTFRIQQQQANGTTNRTIGYIEQCRHPTILDGLCAVCGSPVRTVVSSTNPDEVNDNQLEKFIVDEETKEHHEQQQQVVQTTANQQKITISGGITITISDEEGRQIAEQEAIRLHKLGKLSLVLDLDHTLVHATSDVRAFSYCHERSDVRSLVLDIPNANSGTSLRQRQQHYVKIRPYLKEFLTEAMSMYEISIYTAGTRDYAEEVAMLLARHIVGAKLDSIDIDYLRNRVNEAEVKYKRYQASSSGSQANKNDTDTDNNVEKWTKKKLKVSIDDGKDSDTTIRNTTISNPTKETINVNLIDDANVNDSSENVIEEEATNAESEEQTGGATTEGILKGTIPRKKKSNPDRKRKLVTFDEAIQTESSDKIKEIELRKLQAELAEVEEQQQKAQELRQKMFANRIVSRTDVEDLGQNVKSLNRIFPCGGSMAAVVDDREDVWANAPDDTLHPKNQSSKETTERNNNRRRFGEPPENLLLIRPYHFKKFLGFADINNSSGKDYSLVTKNSKAENDDNEGDEQLLWILDILKRLHYRYYSSNTFKTTEDSSHLNTKLRRLTVPDILYKMRKEVLSNFRIVLSGLTPLHKQSINYAVDVTTARPPYIRFVDNLGAILQNDVDMRTTHVVTARDGTDKALAGRRYKSKVVKPTWLMECYWSISFRDEEPHLWVANNKSAEIKNSKTSSTSRSSEVEEENLVDKETKQSISPAVSTRSASSDNIDEEDENDEEEDDDLAAEFENEFFAEEVSNDEEEDGDDEGGNGFDYS